MIASPIELTGIYIYPVKSLRGVRLGEVSVENGRLPGDRAWLLVDARERFMHQRDYARMARIETAITARGVSVRSDGLPALELVRPERSEAEPGQFTHVRLWRRGAPVAPVGPEADRWFTEALGVPCRLMAFVADAPALDAPPSEVDASLHDAVPFHLTSEDSLADLNRRTAVPIPMNRFRPNLVVRGAGPYAEDGWKSIAIGENVFRWIRPCTRCAITTTDQVTGVRASKDPLLALSKYRRAGSEVVFGHYIVAERWGGTLRVGDPIAVLE